MSEPLQLLIVEDSKLDTELVINELEKSGFDVHYEQVFDKDHLTNALQTKKWNLIICDYSMPQFTGIEALTLVRQQDENIPFIFVSGTIGEDRAVESMKLGANDYILKGNLKRLAPAIKRELNEAVLRQNHKELQNDLFESEERYRELVEFSPDSIFIIQEERFVFVNHAGIKLFGANHQDQLINRSFWECVPVEQENLTTRHDRNSFTNSGHIENVTQAPPQHTIDNDSRSLEIDSKVLIKNSFPNGINLSTPTSILQIFKLNELENDSLQTHGNDTRHITFEGKIQRLDGDIIDVQAIRSRLFYNHQPAEYVIMRDISDQKKELLEKELENIVTKYIAESSTQQEANDKILESFCQKFSWDLGLLYATKGKENNLSLTSIYSQWVSRKEINKQFPEKISDKATSSDSTIINVVLKNKEPFWVSDISVAESYSEAQYSTLVDMHNALICPVIYENEILGIIELFSKKLEKPNMTTIDALRKAGERLGFFFKRQELETQLSYISLHDNLTGLYNRYHLEQELTLKINQSKNGQLKFAFLVLDVDNFRSINESIGHQGGDLVLKQISDRLLFVLPTNCLVSRLEGDEFAIVLFDVHQADEITEITKKIRETFSSPIVLDEHTFNITFSLGVTFYPKDGLNTQELLKNTYVATYRVKELGRNDLQFYKREMTEKARTKIALAQDLRLALDNNEFILYYQPKIEIKSNRVIGVEALIRWQKSDKIIPPNKFISLAEENGLIIPIGQWALRKACTIIKKLNDTQLRNSPITVSVNVSFRQFKDPQFVPKVKKILEETQIDPNHLELELTETLLMENFEDAISIISELNKLGIKISIDDFGTGYSSFGHLKKYQLTNLKIDKSFVDEITSDDSKAIITAIISMAKNLGYRTIAEGVETNAQLEILSDLDCEEVQGYLFSRPLPIDQVTTFFNTRKT